MGCGFGLLALLATAPAARADAFQDGLSHVFDGSCDDLTVRNNYWDEPTSVEMVSGAQVSYIGGVYHSSELTVSGGSITGNLYAYESSQVTVSGGSIGYLSAGGGSQVTVSGGTIEGMLHIYSNLTIEGIDEPDFAIDGRLVGHGTYTRPDERDPVYGSLSGTLASGETFTNNFTIHGDGQLVLVPEPATLALLAVGGVGVLLRRRRRRIS